MERRVFGFYIAVILLSAGLILTSLDSRIKDATTTIKYNPNLEIEALAINNINDELKNRYLKIDNQLPVINLLNIADKESRKEKKEETKKEIITEKKVTTKKLYGTNKKITTTIKYEVSSNSKKQISKKKSTKYIVSDKLLKTANEWYEKESSYMKESLKYINGYRKKANSKNVNLDKKLCIAAYIRAYEISKSNKFSHTRPGNRRCFTILNDLKIRYYYAGENLAMGSYDSPENVVNAWAYSKSHYKNLIMPQYNKVGLAYIKVNDTYYWTQIFTN